MNILLTGCNGQLGSELRLLEKNHPQLHFYNTDIDNLDITNQDQVHSFVEKNAVDGIINCAAYTAVDKAESDRDTCFLLNRTAPVYLAEAIEKKKGWMIHISTDYVFDGTNHIPYKETDLTCPNSVYGCSKLAGEEAIRNICQKVVILRTAWLYSEFGNNFIKTMLRLGREKNELGVIYDQVGTPTYAKDLAETILTIIIKGIVPGIYHYSNEGVISWYDFAKAIHRIANITSCQITPIHTTDYPTPAQRPHYSVLDKTKIKETFQLNIPYWEESLKECIRKIENNV